MSATKSVIASALLAMVLIASAGAARAQQFAGQTINMIVNFTAGGPTDVEARIIAQYLPRYLPGITAIVIRNVGGGGGNIGINQLGEATGRDKLSVGFFTWNPLNQLIHEPTLHVRYNDLKFIAGMRQTSLIYMRRDTPPGMKKPADIAQAQFFRAGAMGPSNIATIRQRLALDLLGAKYDTIHGYKGLRDIDLAMLQGDIQVSSNSLPGYFTSAKPNLVDRGIVIPLLQYDRADASAGRNPDLPDVPTFLELYKQIHGKDAMPSGDKWQALQFLTRIVDSMYRTVFMAPGAPAAAVDEMRAAFDKLGRDPEFIVQYEKVALTKPNFLIGTPGERIISELDSISPALLSFFPKYIGEAK